MRVLLRTQVLLRTHLTVLSILFISAGILVCVLDKIPCTLLKYFQMYLAPCRYVRTYIHMYVHVYMNIHTYMHAYMYSYNIKQTLVKALLSQKHGTEC